MSKTALVVCDGCSREFQKTNSEINRAIKRKITKHYCSNKCQAIHANNSRGNLANLRHGSCRDQFSPFRYYVSKAKNRNKICKFDQTDLTLEFLKELWEKQKGICPLTGWYLKLPDTIGEWSKTKVSMNTASLDRIEPRKPYIQGNVRFVAHIANMAKHVYKDEDVIEFCKAVVSHHQ